MKKVFMTVLLLLALMVSFGITANAEETTSGTCGGNLTWILEDGTLTIFGVGEMYNYEDPTDIWTSNDESNPPWILFKSEIKTVIVEKGVTSIGKHAFTALGELSNVILPEGVTKIGYEAFKDCHSLTDITLPEGLISIGGYSFSFCESLVSITIPKSVTSIGGSAFHSELILCVNGENAAVTEYASHQGNPIAYLENGIFGGTVEMLNWSIDPNTGVLALTGTGKVPDLNTDNSPWYPYRRMITSLELPDTLTEIGASAFQNLSELREVHIPASVTSIGLNAFWACENLQDVYISDLRAWLSIEFKNYGSTPMRYADNIYLNNDLLTKITIPEDVTSIGNYAFRGCSSLTSVTIPGSVTSIGDHAFYGCDSLAGITIPEGVTSIGNNAFGSDVVFIVNGENVAVTEYALSKGNQIIDLGKDILSGKVGELNWSIDPRTGVLALTGSGKIPALDMDNSPWYPYRAVITGLELPDTLTGIGAHAFRSLSRLRDVYIPESVNSIGNSAFEFCTSLTHVTIGNGVTSIGGYAFYNCSSLTSITIPESVTQIGDQTFYNCSSLTSVTIPGSVTQIGYKTFSYCSSLTSITIPRSVTRIRNSAFSNCDGLTSITIPGSVTSIDDYAFGGCDSLTEVAISEGVISIGNSAFQFCSSLTSITIPESVTQIGYQTFYNCSSLTSITIPEGVTSIGDYAFYKCIGLTAITIPNSVTSIGNKAFWYCDKLVYLWIGNGVTSMGESAFGGTSLTDVYIREGNAQWSTNWFSGFGSSRIHLVDMKGNKITELTLGTSFTEIPDSAFVDFWHLTSIVIPDSVISIGDSAFKDLTELKSVTIGNGAISIGNDAFSGCTSLMRATVGKGVTSIGPGAFPAHVLIVTTKSVKAATQYAERYGNPILYLDDSDEVNVVGGTAGKYTWSLNKATGVLTLAGSGNMPNFTSENPPWHDYNIYITSLELPDTMTRIGAFAFWGLTQVEKVHIPDSVTDIQNCAFKGCTGLTGIDIPDSVTSIGKYAFNYCTALKNVTIGNGVTSIGKYAFRGCTNLTNLTLRSGSGDISFGSDAFDDCTSLTDVYIVDHCAWLTSDWLYNDYLQGIRRHLVDAEGNEITELILDDAITVIPHKAFEYFENLTSIVIPDSVNSIGTYAFRYCTSLTHVTIGNGVTSIGSEAFKGCTRLTSITIPYSVTIINQNVFSGCTDLKNVVVYSKTCNFAADCGITYDHVIYGYKGSTAEALADDLGAEFFALEEGCPPGDDGQVQHRWINATCTAPKTCSVCGATEGGVLGHTEATVSGYAATCTKTGLTDGVKCSVCGDTLVAQTTISATGHSYSYAVSKNPTTSATGTLTGTCSTCKGTTTVTLPKLNTTDYTYTVKTATTCTADGTGTYTWKTTTYGSFSFDVTLTKIGHSYSYAATKNPTTSATGTLTGICSKCKGTTTVTLPKLNTTDYAYAVKMAATCTADGTGTYTWKTTIYGSFSFNATLIKTGHSYSNGTCSYCGADDPNDINVGLIGDISGDGRVNMGDVAKLYAHIKGTSILTDETGLDRCDISGDGRVNMGDVAKLYAHIKGTNKLY